VAALDAFKRAVEDERELYNALRAENRIAKEKHAGDEAVVIFDKEGSAPNGALFIAFDEAIGRM